MQNKLIETFKTYSNNIAISEKSRKIIYLDLENSVKKVVSVISGNNLKHELIAIDIEDSIDHVIAILGIVLSGNYYISITEENRYYFKDENNLPIKCMLISENNTFQPITQFKYFNINEILKHPTIDDNLTTIKFANENQFLCSFITSGSTGNPKVVFHKVKSIFQDTLRQIQDNEITKNDKIDQLFSFAFSASLATIFPALLTGSEFCFLNLKKDGINNLSLFWEQKSISFASLSVSSFRALCKLHNSFHHLKSLRFLSIGAEPITESDIESFRNKFPNNTILQIAYATTETRTITEYKIDNNNHSQKYMASVGKPVAGKSVTIISNDGKILPHLSIGEIVVESSFIADEYFNNKVETSKSFKKINDKIIYKTEDLGYFNQDGYLFYTGRKFEDIKINGFKIDLRLIENVLKSDDRIKEASALIYIKDDKKYLAVFVQTNKQIEMDSLKFTLSTKLPVSHLPHLLIKIDKMPLTHTGKINKIELISLISKMTNNTIKEVGVIYEVSSLEKKIINVFNKVLKITNTNPDSNFYRDLGIDSLMIIICQTEIEKELNIALPNYALQSCQTPQMLSKFIDFNLFNEFVHTCPINTYVKGRKSLFIIHSLINDDLYSSFIKSAITDNFNLSFLYYDFYGIPYRENCLQNILNRMYEILSKEEYCIVAGFSFNGYIAQQLAILSPNISFTILFDTINYFEYEKYVTKMNVFQLLINIVTKLIVEKDFGLPMFLIKIIKDKFNNKFEINFSDSILNKTINFILKEQNTKKALCNCIMFQSTRSYVNNLEHGKNWEKYFAKKFHLFYIKSAHNQILNNNNTAKIAKQIIETCSSYD
jgi:acyl-coenzyme A synthetase/AMP-(fatty) acid ligase/acyl carrier protein